MSIDATINAGVACGTHGVIWSDGRCIPVGIVDPVVPWMFDTATPALAAVLVLIIIGNCLRVRALTWSFLLAMASATTWWLETFGDWAQHLLYSPVLNHYKLDWPYTAPHNPNLMPVTYALYWWAHAWVILRMAQWIHVRNSRISLGFGIVLLSAPVTFLWNLIIEGAATYLGWWTYDPPIGPAIHWARDTYWPLLWPVMLMMGWINLIAWMVGLPEEQMHLNKLERLFRLDKLLCRPGWYKTLDPKLNPAQGNWKFQSVRFLAWVLFFNVTFALTLNLPLYLMRMVFGFHSEFLPLPG